MRIYLFSSHMVYVPQGQSPYYLYVYLCPTAPGAMDQDHACGIHLVNLCLKDVE